MHSVSSSASRPAFHWLTRLLVAVAAVHGAAILHSWIVVLAAHLGIAVFRKLSNRQFNCVVYGLLVAAGLTLVMKVV
jgi:hypothetical protein